MKNKKGLYTQQKVYDLMKVLDLPLPHEDKPGIDNLNFVLYRKLVKEEAEEFDEAIRGLSAAYTNRLYDLELYYWAQVIDAMCDIMVVVHNCSNAMGIDLKPFFDEVHRTNLLKADGPLNEYGKRMKPSGWKPPKIKQMLEEVLENSNE